MSCQPARCGRTRARLPALGAALVVAVLVVAAGCRPTEDDSQTAPAEPQLVESDTEAHQALIGLPAPPLDADTWIGGDPTTLADLRGQVVLIDFWAVWCGPCVVAFPHLRDWHARYHDRGLAMVGATAHYGFGWDAERQAPVPNAEISAADEVAAIEAFVAHHELPYRQAILSGPAAPAFQRYRVTAIPLVVLIDRKGNVRFTRMGGRPGTAGEIEQMIERLLDEPAP